VNIAHFMCHFTLVAGAGRPGDANARHRRSDSLIVGWELPALLRLAILMGDRTCT
jgi:hypothetical protein